MQFQTAEALTMPLRDCNWFSFYIVLTEPNQSKHVLSFTKSDRKFG